MNITSKPAGRTIAASLCAVIIAGCSGGSDVTPGTAPAPVASAPGKSSTKKSNVTVTFTLPRTSSKTSKVARSTNARHRDYVSPGTLGAYIVATSTTVANQAANDATYGYDLSPTSSLCAVNVLGGGYTCTLTLGLSNDTYTISLYTTDTVESNATPMAGTALAMGGGTFTIGSGDNTFAITEEPYVEGFEFDEEENDDGARRRPGSQRRRAAPVPTAATHLGAAFGFTTNYEPFEARALDRASYYIDEYPPLTAFVNGAFTINVAALGDTTGCSTADPCASASSDDGASYAPAMAGTTPATISEADYSNQEAFTPAYSGGGGPGAGIESWTLGTVPSGPQPFSADISLPDPSGGLVTSYIVPHLYIDPLYAYETDGAGNPTSTGPVGGGNIYVWAAQAAIPSFLPTDGSGYTASFFGSSECDDGNDDVVATVDAGQTYYAGYGELFTVTTTPAEESSCTLIISDGDGDDQPVSFTVPAAIIESKGRVPAPRLRRR